MTPRRVILALVALVVAVLGAAAALGGGGGSAREPVPSRDVPGTGPAKAPSAASARRDPGTEEAPPADGAGWSGPPRREVNAAGLARAASRREKQRAVACEPRERGEPVRGCEPAPSAESAEVDWNARRASP